MESNYGQTQVTACLNRMQKWIDSYQNVVIRSTADDVGDVDISTLTTLERAAHERHQVRARSLRSSAVTEVHAMPGAARLLDDVCLSERRTARVSARTIDKKITAAVKESKASPFLTLILQKYTSVRDYSKLLTATSIYAELNNDFFDVLCHSAQNSSGRFSDWEEFEGILMDMYPLLLASRSALSHAILKRLREHWTKQLDTLNEEREEHDASAMVAKEAFDRIAQQKADLTRNGHPITVRIQEEQNIAEQMYRKHTSASLKLTGPIELANKDLKRTQDDLRHFYKHRAANAAAADDSDWEWEEE